MPAVVRRVVHYKDEIQPFKQLYSQLTFFNFYKKYRPGILLCTVLVARLEGYNVWRFLLRATRRSDLISLIEWTAITAVSHVGCFLFRFLF